MKRYIFLLIVLLLSFDKVYANEICKETLSDIGYNYITEDSNYLYDKEDYIVNYGDWQDYNGEQLENIEVKTSYKYQKVLPVRYIHIYNAGIGTDKLKISELKIFNDKEEVTYEKECVYCNIDTLVYLDDNNYEFEKQFIMDFRNGYLIIDLLDEYELENLRINLYLNDIEVDIKKYYIGFSSVKNKGELITKKFIYEDFKTNKESKLFEYKVNNEWNLNDNYIVEYESDELIEDNIFYEKIDEYEKYRFIDIKYKTYSIEKKCSEVIENDEFKIEEIISPPKVEPEPIIQSLNQKTNNIPKTVETKIENKTEIKESTVTFMGSNIYKEINNFKSTESNKSQSNVFIIIYTLIIISAVVMLFLLKKMSYEK